MPLAPPRLSFGLALRAPCIPVSPSALFMRAQRIAATTKGVLYVVVVHVPPARLLSLLGLHFPEGVEKIARFCGRDLVLGHHLQNNVSFLAAHHYLRYFSRLKCSAASAAETSPRLS